MTMLRTRLLTIVAAGSVAGLLAPAWIDVADAQQKQVPGWAQGRPAELENSPLAPHPSNLKVTPRTRFP